MQYSINNIIQIVICRYLDNNQKEVFLLHNTQWPRLNIGQIINNIEHSINLITLRDKPLIWQDKWLYEYITTANKEAREWPNNELIKRYEDEACIVLILVDTFLV